VVVPSCVGIGGTPLAGRSLMAPLRRIVLDTLKPHDPDILTLAQQLSDLEGISAVNITIVEIDRKVENAKITVVGDDIPYEKAHQLIRELGGTVHSIDEVVAGAKIIDAAKTMQD
jgi:hypothetical protein